MQDDVVRPEALTRWNSTLSDENENGDASSSDAGGSGGGSSKFPANETLNRKLILWEGDLTSLHVDAIVNTTNERLNDRTGISGEIFQRGGADLLTECLQADVCHTGEAVLTKGYDLPAQYVLHTVGPRFSVKYQTAAENALHSCYRRCLEVLKENGLESIAFPLVNTTRKGYPKEAASHIALRTVRRFLEKYGDSVHTVIFCMNSAEDVEIYQRVMPLYFPRSKAEEQKAVSLLPQDTGNELGESVIVERQIRISAMPGMSGDDPIIPSAQPRRFRGSGSGSEDNNYDAAYGYGAGGGVGGGIDSSAPVVDPSFADMQENPDEVRRKSLNDQPAEVTEQEEAERIYYGYLERAREEDLSDMEEHGFLYTSGTDSLGREIVIFVANRLPAATADLERILLYMIRTLDEVVAQDYTVIYFHTDIQSHNKPPLSWLRQVYAIFNRKYKKNLKKLHIVHPSWWVKVVLLFASPFISKKFWKKLHKTDYLMELYEDYDADSLRIPDDILRYDQDVNGEHYASQRDRAAGPSAIAGDDDDDHDAGL